MKKLEKLKIITTDEGDSKETVQSGDIVIMHYTGKLLENGKKFDSSYNRNQPFQVQIGVGRVIRGWDEGIIGMRVGERRTLNIPSEMGYGSSGAGNDIPPNADLTFDVKLLQALRILK
jgi:FKBP-type peptidyl-prolyl cis-trans isomerase